MSIAIRQDNLYNAEDWTVVYTSFKNAEFTSYDFDTLRQSMINYMQINYAEEYNDYIQSSEFIALLDLVAYVGQNLAFRMDLNARENILDTAEKRESVLRIARMLSYKPKRVRPSTGMFKITNVLTTESIVDSTGVDLSNMSVSWGADPSELEYERFVKILDSAFNPSNPFGTPASRTVNSTNGNIFEIYKINNSRPLINYPISVIADGGNFNFDLLSVTVDSDGTITQNDPDYSSSFNILYRNDGRGVGSIHTGFMVLAKQGYIVNKEIPITEAISNLVIDLEQTSNISEDDFYVQTVDSTGAILKSWTRVGNIDYTNIVVNNYGGVEKNLYEVIYSDADVTSIKFGDGNFSNVPTGNLRIWYRLAENSYLRVKAGEVTPIQFSIDYKSNDDVEHRLIMTLELQDNLTVGIPSETTDEIKNNAPEVFYSKNRMVTGGDYSGMIPTLNNDVLLSKVVNRTFSAHSRYVDLSDPTGKSKPIIEFADDGYLFQDTTVVDKFVPDLGTRRNVDILDQFIEKTLLNIGLINFYYGRTDLDSAGDSTKFPMQYTEENFRWTVVKSDSNSANGYVSVFTGGQFVPQQVGATSVGFLKGIKPGAILKVATSNGTHIWVSVVDVKGNGLGLYDQYGNPTGILANGNGTIELSKPITGGTIVAIIPPMARVFDDSTRTQILNLMSEKSSFGLAFNNITPSWTVIQDIDTELNYDSLVARQSWIISVNRDESKQGWLIKSRELNYIFGSENLIRFYNLNFGTGGIVTSNYGNDVIEVLGYENGKFNTKASYMVQAYFNYIDGYSDPTKVKVSPLNLNSDILPTDPEHFAKIAGTNLIDLIQLVEQENAYLVPQNTTGASNAFDTVNGIMKLAFKWTHKTPSDQSLNPSLTNIVDAYILTKTYYQDFIVWKNKNSTATDQPMPMTSEELRNSFKGLSDYKMLTDEVVFHPVTFKPLFGSLADPYFRAEFKVVKSAGSKATDNEIKSKVITAIDEYFAPGNFDFGEKFYFTELSTYIHTKLSKDISSVVIVPIDVAGKFGSLFQIEPNKNEIVISVATVNDISIINEITNTNIKVGQ